MKIYCDPTTGEYVGEYETKMPDGDVRRQTEWFHTHAEAVRFSKRGKA